MIVILKQIKKKEKTQRQQRPELPNHGGSILMESQPEYKILK